MAEAYRQGWQRVDAAAFAGVDGAGAGLDEPCRRPDPGPPVSLRWVLMHLLEETARHAGHADILRELIDGTTGRLPITHSLVGAAKRKQANRANRSTGRRRE